MDFGKATLNLVVIKTDKLKEQFEFYSNLGLRFEYHQHGSGPHHYASVGKSLVIEIYPLPKGVLDPDNTTRLGFNVENLDQLIQNLRDKGVKIISEPLKSDWGYRAIVQDADGRKIELVEDGPDT